jgi:hypothetical protein
MEGVKRGRRERYTVGGEGEREEERKLIAFNSIVHHPSPVFITTQFGFQWAQFDFTTPPASHPAFPDQSRNLRNNYIIIILLDNSLCLFSQYATDSRSELD